MRIHCTITYHVYFLLCLVVHIVDTQCPGGFVLSGTPSACSPCSAGTYIDNSHTTCLQCPENTISPVAATSIVECLAQPGFYGLPGTPAVACPAGYACPASTMWPVRCNTNTSQQAQSCILTSDPVSTESPLTSVSVEHTLTTHFLVIWSASMAAGVIIMYIYRHKLFATSVPEKQQPRTIHIHIQK